LMWFLNIVLPVVIGTYYVLRFKSSPQPSPKEKAI
jgi:hypothetical protein